MKINHGYQDSRATSTQESNRTQETAAPAQAKAARAAAGAGATGGTDEVSLSSLASTLQGALSDSPERAAHLERLASEFAAGTYGTDPEGTARGIISDGLSGTDPSRR
ncbi:MAG TPA: flagellar biosynthesis anti-sigma factor FlgM [Bryobacteraceae bacterium]|nr:flagellar biosynthesis anti-sigma factor FlgM [Bryobacteraceae bacterium]